MNHVVEHLTSPTDTIREVKRILKPGGSLMMTTPNASSLLFAIFRKFWFALETPRHLQIFSEKTLSMMIDSVGGLKIEKIDYNISNYVFAKSLIYRFHLGDSFMARFLMKIKFIFLPLFYLLPRKKRDFVTIYARKK